MITECASEMRDSIAKIRVLQRELTEPQTSWRPPDGGWSVGQVFEHLLLSDQPYEQIITNLLAAAPRADSQWKPTWMGKMVTRAVEPQAPRKLKARPGFQPGPQPRRDVIGEYLALRERLLELLESSKGVDLNRVKMKSPVMGIVRYNLGDAYMILARHTQRHLQQIDRVRRHPDFPK